MHSSYKLVQISLVHTLPITWTGSCPSSFEIKDQTGLDLKALCVTVARVTEVLLGFMMVGAES
jgi:hypothetical protein